MLNLPLHSTTPSTTSSTLALHPLSLTPWCLAPFVCVCWLSVHSTEYLRTSLLLLRLYRSLTARCVIASF